MRVCAGFGRTLRRIPPGTPTAQTAGFGSTASFQRLQTRQRSNSYLAVSTDLEIFSWLYSVDSDGFCALHPSE